MKKIIISLIRAYQYAGRWALRSGQLPILIYADCKFYPTCSDYAVGSINKHGVLKGLIKSGIRILKCNPLAKGGINNP